MNDDNKIVSQNTAPSVQGNQTQPQAQPVQPAQPSAPAGSVNKEAGTVVSPDSEFVKPSEVEPQISQEIKESGVEVKSDRPDLTFEHKELGMNHAGSNITVLTQPSASVKLPMSEEEMAEKLKTGQDDDSGKWLAGLLGKIMKVLGL